MKRVMIENSFNISAQLRYVLIETDEKIDIKLDDDDIMIDIECSVIETIPTKVISTLYGSHSDIKYLPLVGEYIGKITAVGKDVKNLKINDRVCGQIASFDFEKSCCSNYTITSQYDVLPIDDNIEAIKLVDAVNGCLSAYQALFILGKARLDSSVLIINGLQENNFFSTQVAKLKGLNVFVTVDNESNEKIDLAKKLGVEIVSSGFNNRHIVSNVLDQTGGVGVDIIIDDGLCEKSPKKIDLIKCLTLNGRWITKLFNLQLDPPDSLLLYAKSASVSFLPPCALSASVSNRSAFLHAIKEIYLLTAENSLINNVYTIYTWKDILQFLKENVAFNKKIIFANKN